jgi:hypothetical protein
MAFKIKSIQKLLWIPGAIIVMFGLYEIGTFLDGLEIKTENRPSAVSAPSTPSTPTQTELAKDFKPTPPQKNVRVLFDLTALIGASPSEVEARVGKPLEITPITHYPDQMPGEHRDYRVPGVSLNLTDNGLLVRYYKGQVAFCTLDLATPTNDAAEALLMAGIDAEDKTPDITAPIATRWKYLTVRGRLLPEVAAIKSEPTSPFQSVQLNLSR